MTSYKCIWQNETWLLKQKVKNQPSDGHTCTHGSNATRNASQGLNKHCHKLPYYVYTDLGTAQLTKRRILFCLKCSENQSVTITKLSEMYRRRNIKPTDKTTLDSCLSEKQHTRQLYSSSFVPRTLPFIRC